jgi:hypothetical protein
MGKHINFLGYTLWVSDDGKQLPSETVSSRQRFYSAGVLATYSITSNFSVGIFLYSMNLSRRGYLWRGRVLAILSILFLGFLILLRMAHTYSIDWLRLCFMEARSLILIEQYVMVVSQLDGGYR